MGRAERKIEIVTRLLEAAWTNLEAAHDVILVTENGGEDFFTWDEKDGLDSLAANARAMVETMRSRAHEAGQGLPMTAPPAGQQHCETCICRQ